MTRDQQEARLANEIQQAYRVSRTEALKAAKEFIDLANKHGLNNFGIERRKPASFWSLSKMEKGMLQMLGAK